MVDVLILNLNETDIVLDSIRRLKKEPAVNVVVVDNGSDEGHKERLRVTEGIVLIDLPENRGPSVGRNAGLDHTTAPYVFLLDGDILYVPGTIPTLERIINQLPDAGCVGVHHLTLWGGTQIREVADLRMTDPGQPPDDFPMAWTQYGLFRGDLLRQLRFYDQGVFGEAGNGYEDDWLYKDMRRAGFKSYYVPNVLYYHEKHGGQRWLTQKGKDNKNEERREVFTNYWKDTPWHFKVPH